MPPEPNFQTIKREQIECTAPFLPSLADGPVGVVLLERIRQFGQTTPLLVREEQPQRYQLLADYPTYRALAALGSDQVLCRVLPRTVSSLSRFSLQIHYEQAASPPASPIVQAHLLRQACQQLSHDELLSLLPLMGYKPQRYLLDELLALLDLSPAAVRALHQGILAPKTGKLLKLLAPEDQIALVDLIETYRPGGSKQFKLVEMVTELCLRHNRPVRELLKEWEQTEPRQDNAPQRLQGLLQHLAASVSPQRTDMETRFQRFVDAMQLPEGVTLAPSPSFEDESVELRLRFDNSDVLRQKWEKIRKLLQS